MTDVVVKVDVHIPSPEEIKERLAGAKFAKMLDDIAKDMGDQGRLNIKKSGNAGMGEWKQLSGFNHPREQRAKVERMKEEAKTATGVKAATLRQRIRAEEAEARRQERASKRASAQRKQAKAEGVEAKASRHSGYARRKDLGQTPGKGRFGPGVRLRDTGSMNDGMGGEISRIGNGVRVDMVSRGALSGRPTNQRLLEIHATGEGRMPVRNPAEDMKNFEDRVQRRIDEAMSAMDQADRDVVIVKQV